MISTTFTFTAREFSNILVMHAIGENHLALSASKISPAARAAAHKAAAFHHGSTQDPNRGWIVPGTTYPIPGVTAFTVDEVSSLIASAALLAADPAFCAGLNLEGTATAYKVRAYQETNQTWRLTD